MSGSYPADTVDKWCEMQDEFDKDSSKPNPYEEVDNCAFFFNQYLCLLIKSQMSLWPS